MMMIPRKFRLLKWNRQEADFAEFGRRYLLPNFLRGISIFAIIFLFAVVFDAFK